MGFVTKLIGLALPALAGCGMFSHVPTQGAGKAGGLAGAPFGTVSAYSVDVEISIDAGKYAAQNGGRVYLTYPKAPNVSNQDLKVIGTIGSVPMETIKDVHGREILGGWAASSSGRAVIKITGTIYERVITQEMVHPKPQLTEQERKMFTQPNWLVPHDRAAYRQGLRNAGLVAKQGEDAYDWAVRMCRWLKQNRRYSTNDNAGYALEQLWQFPAFNCNRATKFIVAGARASSFPARELVQIWGAQDVGLAYHSVAEVYSKKKGWFSVDGSQVLQVQSSALDRFVGADLGSSTSSGRPVTVMNGAGYEYEVPAAAGVAVRRGFGQSFWMTSADGRVNQAIHPNENTTRFKVERLVRE